jgi:acyl carrier protein
MELRTFLRKMVPDYMVPSAFLLLEGLPLTPNGKIDRRGLPVPEGLRAQLENQFVAPRGMLEEQVAGIWSEVLGVERVGAHDNFFELGGSSLQATQVIWRLRDTFAVELLLRDLFTAPTVAGLAVEITQRQVEETDSKEIERLLAELEGLSKDDEHR